MNVNENRRKNKIVFDLETTGFPDKRGFDVYYDPSEIHKYRDARVVQIGWIVLSSNNEVLSKNSHIIYPKNFVITNDFIHGITQERAVEEGKSIEDVIDIFTEDLKECDTLVSHNLVFDYNIFLSECFRCYKYNTVKEMKSKETYCTMRKGKEIFGISKYPKLIELVLRLLPDEKWNQVHDALDDAEWCAKCYVELVKMR